jgi:hypothetical protein
MGGQAAGVHVETVRYYQRSGLVGAQSHMASKPTEKTL